MEYFLTLFKEVVELSYDNMPELVRERLGNAFLTGRLPFKLVILEDMMFVPVVATLVLRKLDWLFSKPTCVMGFTGELTKNHKLQLDALVPKKKRVRTKRTNN